MEKDIQKAINILKQGGIVIFPTDTAYGIGCRIDNTDSVKRLFKIRRRPRSMAVPVLVDSVSMAKTLLLSPFPNNVRRIMKDYWPGALTIVYKCRLKAVSPLVCGGGKNLGVRMPDNNKILDIIKEVGVPILGPSANFHGDKTPYKEQDLNKDLLKLVDFVVLGVCKTKLSSTVVDTTVVPWKILRQGKTIIDFKNYV